MQAPNSSTITLLVVLPLIAWRMYSRVRKLVGRQRLSKIRPWITLVIFPSLLVLLAFLSSSHLDRLMYMAGGLIIGSGLAVYGLKKTVFEPTPQGLFYTPNAHLGIALSLLFFCRIVYRMLDVDVLNPLDSHDMGNFAGSPLTLAVFGLLASYYIGYAIGLLRWRFAVLRAKAERELMASVDVAPDAAQTI
ncbi:hypothetical protein QN372_09465 [Undibacterium sp. RTI2.1]|uniref:hypothetical protein n=1 Tax=unclassified Undibacterium TaxID=2630295 RepID=UPI002B22741E|nr:MULTISPECIES: hypothetical protein [unclassified Undibacterium]MEB0030974.1 hypothetical protein [Undibacterium sp. RTI2.1]MEB0115821.1 hypothetical protein [Undibacterium sp. RTI2.2]